MGGRAAADGHERTAAIGGVDWRAVAHSDEFPELVRSKRAFIVPASAVFFSVFLAYLLLAAFAEDFMGSEIVDGLPVAWFLAGCQVVMTWIVTWLYLRKADREWDPLERRAAERAESLTSSAEAPAFEREGHGAVRAR
jgi:uncharacterized membrane protein (DUF485 family)